MLVQGFLRERGSVGIADLAAHFGISAKRHQEFPSLVLLKYDQLASPFAEPIVRECRGVILDEADDWRVVSRAFDKFFNYGEALAEDIDWSTARVQEKVDGSLVVLYPYAGTWHAATSGTPDAGGDVNGGTQTFRALFWRTFAGRRLPEPERTCFYFELTTPENRVVVQHAAASLTLLGARHLDDGEVPVESALCMLGEQVPAVRTFDLRSFEGIAASFASMSPLVQEGYVVVDGAFRRVKVKHPGYVALHHARDGLTTKAFVEIARKGESSEVIAAFPEFAPRLAEARRCVDAFVAELEGDYARLAGIAEQKAFAAEALKTRCSGALFAVRAGKAASIRAHVAEMRIGALLDMLDVAP